MIKIKNINELKRLFEEFGYFPTDYMMEEVYLALKKLGGKTSTGQKTWSMCLDGPAGAGKSSFVETYKDVANYLFDEKIEFISFQCNDTVGKSDFYEEVGMVAVVIKDKEKIIIPGCVVRAIEEVNRGNKVILLLDELDKARPESDVFFYDFLQSGKINTTQLGDLSIKPEYMSNLQVFFCKNDMRELTPPLIRRSRSLKLEYMKPELFYKIAVNNLLKDENPGIDALINLISLIYEFTYENKEKFDRLPATNEMLIAIEDAYDLTSDLDISESDVYKLILNRLFKDQDNYDSYVGLIKETKLEKYKGLKNIIDIISTSENEMKETTLRELISKNILEETLKDKTKELDELKTQCKNEKAELESQKAQLLKERMELRTGSNEKDSNEQKVNIGLNGGELVLKDVLNNSITNFNDSTDTILRGKNIFEVNKDGYWTKFASLNMKENIHQNIIPTIINQASDLDIKIYENGILYYDSLISLIMTCEKSENNEIKYNFYSSNPVIPSSFILILSSVLEYLNLVIKSSYSKPVINGVTVDALVYNDNELPFDSVTTNVYHFNIENVNIEEFVQNAESLDLVCEDKSKVLETFIELMDKNTKKLTL